MTNNNYTITTHKTANDFFRGATSWGLVGGFA